MTSSQHKNAPLIDVHSTLGLGPFATAALRRAAVVTSSDLGKHAFQTDTDPPTEWSLLKAASGVGSWGLCATAETLVTGPLVVMAGHIFAGFIPETGLTSGGWTDVGPNGLHLNAGACTVQTNQINGFSCAKFVSASSNQIYRASAAHAAPGTTPLYRYTVLRIDTYANNLTIAAMGPSNEMGLLMHTSTPALSQWNFSITNYGNVNAGGAAVGSFKLIKEKFSNSTGDFIKCAAGTSVTGTSNGNTAGVGIYLGGSNGSFVDCSIAENWYFDQDPGTSLDTYFTTKFGASVLT